MSTRMIAVLLTLLIYLAVGQTRREPSGARVLDQSKRTLAFAVAEALKQSHRGGALIYKGKCVSESQITDTYSVDPLVTTESMDQALNEIKRQYPTIEWIDYGENAVRVIDSSARTDVLNVRVREFRLTEVENPHMAISAVWDIPELKAFAAKNHITFVLNTSGLVPPAGTYTRISVDAHDATLAEIMDKITQSYRKTADPSWRGMWTYHECETRGNMIVELQVR